MVSRCTAPPAVLAAVVVMALLAPAACQRLRTPGASAVGADRQLRLFQAVVDGMAQMGVDMSLNRTRNELPASGSVVQAAAAAAGQPQLQPPVPNVTPKEVSAAIATVLAAAAIKNEVLGTLGDPQPWT